MPTIEEQLAEYGEYLDELGERGRAPIDLLAPPPPAPAPQVPRAVLSAAAVLVVAVALGAGVTAVTRDDGERDGDVDVVADAEGEAGELPPPMVFDPVPEGLEMDELVPRPPGQSSGEIVGSSTLFGDPDADDTFASGDLVVDVSRGSGVHELGRVLTDELEPTTVRGGTDAWVWGGERGFTRLVWLEGDVLVSVGSRSMSRQELAALAEAIDLDDPAALPAGALPAGLEPVAHRRSDERQRGGSWIARYSGPGGSRRVVSEHGDLDDQLLWMEHAQGAPLPRVEVRGREGVVIRPDGDDREQGTDLVWQEAPGHLVTVGGPGSAVVEELVADAESVRQVSEEDAREQDDIPGLRLPGPVAEGEVEGGARWELTVTPGDGGEGPSSVDVEITSPSGEPWGDVGYGGAGPIDGVVGSPLGVDLPGADVMLLFGLVRDDVAAVRLEPAGGEPVEVPTSAVEGVGGRIYAGVVRAADVVVEVVGLDADGRELGRFPMQLPPAVPDEWCQEHAFGCPE